MKKIFYFIILISFSYSQQGLNLEELETSSNGVMMYPYSGKVFEYWPNGDLKVKGRLRNGLRNGKWEYYHTNGSKMAVGKYFDGNGSKIDPETKIAMHGFTSDLTISMTFFVLVSNSSSVNHI